MKSNNQANHSSDNGPRMEAKPGYKMTEVGLIPEEWAALTLGSLNPFITSGSRGWATYYAETGDAFIRITNMSRETIHLDLADLKCVRLPPNSTEGTRTRLQSGDILVSITADIGIASIVTVATPNPAYINQHIAVVRLPSSVDSLFVCYFLASAPIQRLFKMATDAGAKAGMSLHGVSQIHTALPPLPEQRAIAAALSDADALIAKLDQLIAKKRDLKLAAMQQLLTGKRRLPGFWTSENSHLKPCGELPSEWQVVELRSIAAIKTGPFGSALHESDYATAGTPIITVEHLGEFGVSHVGLPLVAEADIKRLAAYSLESGDIVFSRVGSVDRSSIIAEAENGWLFSGRLLRLRWLCNNVNSQFMSSQFQTEPFKQRVRSIAVGQTMPSLNTRLLGSVSVTLPQLAEQTAIATVLSDMDAEIEALERRRAKARDIKTGMMQELLTGRIRLV